MHGFNGPISRTRHIERWSVWRRTSLPKRSVSSESRSGGRGAARRSAGAVSSPLALIAGIPLGAFQRSRKNPTRVGWIVRTIPSAEHRRANLRTIWSRVLNETNRPFADGVHLILSHDREDERPAFSELQSMSLRATWLPRELSYLYGQATFCSAVDDILSYEECWRATIRPQIDSPLLLPETSFSAQHSVMDMWSRARNAGRRKPDRSPKRYHKIHSSPRSLA